MRGTITIKLIAKITVKYVSPLMATSASCHDFSISFSRRMISNFTIKRYSERQS